MDQNWERVGVKQAMIISKLGNVANSTEAPSGKGGRLGAVEK